MNQNVKHAGYYVSFKMVNGKKVPKAVFTCRSRKEAKRLFGPMVAYYGHIRPRIGGTK